jgi:hypothetical protein
LFILVTNPFGLNVTGLMMGFLFKLVVDFRILLVCPVFEAIFALASYSTITFYNTPTNFAVRFN